MKKTFSTIEDCIHTYAQFSQNEGKSGNVFFYGNTLYSYGYHFPLAHLTTNDKGGTAILLNGLSYSNSTARHQHTTQAATRHYNQIVSYGLGRDTSSRDLGHDKNTAYYIAEFQAIARKLATARQPGIYILEAQNLNEKACRYFDFFNLGLPDDYQAAYKAATEVSEELKAKVKADQAETLRRKKEREIEEKKAYEIKVSEWIAGERGSLYPRPAIDILRRSGDQVETSQGVKMTIQWAKAIYVAIASKTLSPGDKVLDQGYTVTKVNGTVKIGCHTFDTDYLLTFGKSL